MYGRADGMPSSQEAMVVRGSQALVWTYISAKDLADGILSVARDSLVSLIFVAWNWQ